MGWHGSAAAATALAVAYQLVTPHSNFVLVHARAEGDTATGMPRLHTVAQMVPAGWSGFGTVTADVPQAAPAAAYGPAVFRRAPSSRITPPTMGPIYDIPAFLRRSDAPAKRPRCTLDDHSPQGLRDWLQATPPARWPSSYAALRRIGLDAWVVDWLELAVGPACAEQASEREVVGAFLALLAQDSAPSALPAALPYSLHQTLAQALAPVWADPAAPWPDAVYALDGVAAG